MGARAGSRAAFCEARAFPGNRRGAAGRRPGRQSGAVAIPVAIAGEVAIAGVVAIPVTILLAVVAPQPPLRLLSWVIKGEMWLGSPRSGVTGVRGFRVSWGLVVLARPGCRRCNTPPAGTALLQLIGFPLRFPKLGVIRGNAGVPGWFWGGWESRGGCWSSRTQRRLGGYLTSCTSNLCLSHISDDFLLTPESGFLLVFLRPGSIFLLPKMPAEALEAIPARLARLPTCPPTNRGSSRAPGSKGALSST